MYFLISYFTSYHAVYSLNFSICRPDAIDGALLRSGRFGQRLEVPLPSPDGRVNILKTLAKGRPIDDSVDLSVIGRMKECENFSGADLAALVCLCSLYFF
jgi:ATP-dependent 26S proteasome regulatory subunit